MNKETDRIKSQERFGYAGPFYFMVFFDLKSLF